MHLKFVHSVPLFCALGTTFLCIRYHFFVHSVPHFCAFGTTFLCIQYQIFGAFGTTFLCIRYHFFVHSVPNFCAFCTTFLVHLLLVILKIELCMWYWYGTSLSKCKPLVPTPCIIIAKARIQIIQKIEFNHAHLFAFLRYSGGSCYNILFIELLIASMYFEASSVDLLSIPSLPWDFHSNNYWLLVTLPLANFEQNQVDVLQAIEGLGFYRKFKAFHKTWCVSTSNTIAIWREFKKLVEHRYTATVAPQNTGLICKFYLISFHINSK